MRIPSLFRIIGSVLILIPFGLNMAAGADFCQTQEIYEQEFLSMFGYLPSDCLKGDCDATDTRDSWIPGPNDPPITLRLYFNVFAEDDGSNPAATPSDIENQVAQINTDMLPYRVQFVYDMRTINSTQYRYLSGSEVDQMKLTYAVQPDSQCNVYVASYGSSFGTFPWDQARPPLSYKGGIVLAESHCYPTSVHVLTHEMGHNIGLWHTHHGVSEVTQCSDCWEQADGAHADSTGDLCSDTPPTPVNFACADPGGTDPCSGVPWGVTSPENYMSYGGDNCWSVFTGQQSGRIHCWIDEVLSNWAVCPASPPSFARTYGADGSERAIYGTQLRDTTWGGQNETVIADVDDGPVSRTMAVAQQVSYHLYIPSGSCDMYSYAVVKLNGTPVDILYCDDPYEEKSGSFAVQAGDVVTALVDGLLNPDKKPPAESRFTYYNAYPTSIDPTGFAFGGTVSPLTGQEYHIVSADADDGPISRTMTVAQQVPYYLYIPSGSCDMYSYSVVKRNGTPMATLYCDDPSEELSGSFSVQPGDEVTAYVDGLFIPDKKPPAESRFTYYDLVPGDGDFQLIKTDPCGEEIWNITRGTAADDQARSAQLTSDGGYVLAGYSESGTSSDVYVVKFTDGGSFAWEQTFTHGVVDRAASIHETNDGGYAILGTTDAGGDDDLLLIKTDASGNEQWRRTYGIAGTDEEAGEVWQAPGGDYTLVGSARPNGTDWDVFLVKTDGSGAETFSDYYGQVNVNEQGRSLVKTTAGYYVIAGTSDGSGTLDALLVKLTGSGGHVWSSTIGGNGIDAAEDIMIAGDDNYVVSGKSSSAGYGLHDSYIAKVATDGSLIWSTTFGGTLDDCANSIAPTLDGGYLLTGWTKSFGVDYSDFYVVKFLTPPPVAPSLVSPSNGTRWYTYGAIQVTLDWDDVSGAGYYQVLLDNNSDFSSPISDPDNVLSSTWTTPSLGWATYYWKIRAWNETGWGEWSEVWHFSISRKSDPSCPVLFRFDGNEFQEENPLLTACEKSGYADVVTDFYHLTQSIAPENGQLIFQLREMEDEITYLHDISLLVVDHADNTKIACSVDGRIGVYNEAVEPLSAVDHNGIDRLDEVKAKDGRMFSAAGPGYLVVTFPDTDGQTIGFQTTAEQKPRPCEELEEDVLDKAAVADADDSAGDLKVEIRNANGEWKTLTGLPSRDRVTEEIVFTDRMTDSPRGTTTLRLSWEKGYATDAISQIVPVDGPLNIVECTVDEFELLWAKPNPDGWHGFDDGSPLILTNGDIFEFRFAAQSTPERGMIRDYIIKAVGRYEPDYLADADLVPGQYQLYNSYPNPFNPTTTIQYDLPKPTHVKLHVFNVLGQVVATLVDEQQEAGRYQVVWDGRDERGNVAASGIYLYRMETDDFVKSKKMLLLK